MKTEKTNNMKTQDEIAAYIKQSLEYDVFGLAAKKGWTEGEGWGIRHGMKANITVYNPNGTTHEIAGDSQKAHVYRALSNAADRMGRSGYAAHFASKHRNRPYIPTQEHRDVIKAMSDVLGGEITAEEAMAMLHEHDVLKQRTA